jgi:hypothetical protein
VVVVMVVVTIASQGGNSRKEGEGDRADEETKYVHIPYDSRVTVLVTIIVIQVLSK